MLLLLFFSSFFFLYCVALFLYCSAQLRATMTPNQSTSAYSDIIFLHFILIYLVVYANENGSEVMMRRKNGTRTRRPSPSMPWMKTNICKAPVGNILFTSIRVFPCCMNCCWRCPLPVAVAVAHFRPHLHCLHYFADCFFRDVKENFANRTLALLRGPFFFSAFRTTFLFSNYNRILIL